MRHVSACCLNSHSLLPVCDFIRITNTFSALRPAAAESTNERVKWWSIFQTAVMLSAGLWQIWHVKRFLKNKKVV